MFEGFEVELMEVTGASEQNSTDSCRSGADLRVRII
ncbi:hypothetical protein SVIOM74S_06291 [Streptomyces violarus]|jgi:hypothetical protein